MQVNLLGGYFMVPGRGEPDGQAGHGGAIVAVSSISALVGGEYQTHYTPTKAGLHSLMQSTAIALGKHGIRCNSVLPGTILTEINKDDLADEEKRKYMEGPHPARPARQPEDLDRADRVPRFGHGAYVTGAALLVDGGAFVNTAASSAT
jgi:L-rhamnose 1-dehydrogenase